MKRKKAAALKYTKDFNVPVVTAIGSGQVAENIIKQAASNKIPIIQNESLTDEISKLSLGESIPPELYEVVAEIIAYIYSLNSKF